MKNQRRRLLALALVLCMLLPLFATVNAAETEPVADTPAAEAPQTAVPATEMPASTSLEPIEAEQQVSLSDDGICIIKGESKSLIPEPEANRGDAALGTAASANPLTAAGVVWISSDPTVATVDSTGTVTAHELGETTITATLNSSVLETFTVYSILSDGIYAIQAFSSVHMLCADDISMVSNLGMFALPQSVLGSEECSLRDEMCYRWYIDYQSSGYYTIHPIHSRGMALHIFGGTTPVLRQETGTPSQLSQWSISRGSYGYVFQNRAAPTVTFKFSGSASGASDSDIDYSDVVAVTYSTTDRYQSWDIYAVSSLSGMLLYNTDTGEVVDDKLYSAEEDALVDDMWNTHETNHIAFIKKGVASSLPDIGVYVQVLDPSNTSQSFTISFSPSYATFNMSNSTITGSTIGTTTATVNRAINGELVSLQFDLTVCNSVEHVTVIYDAAYANRYGDEVDYINQQTQALANKYLNDLGIGLRFTVPTQFQSYGDTCSTSYSVNCSHGTCQNSIVHFDGSVTEYDYHHKNAHNILVNLPRYDDSNTLAYIGHNVCQVTSGHSINNPNGLGGYLYGLAAEPLGVCEIMDHTNLSSSKLTTVHEFGHLLGARDHYTTSGDSTEDLNNEYQTSLFSRFCIYGENRFVESVTSNYTICPGCEALIKDELPLPS